MRRSPEPAVQSHLPHARWSPAPETKTQSQPVPTHSPCWEGQTQPHVWDRQPWGNQKECPQGHEANSVAIYPSRLEGGLTLPWVTTLTDPFQIMYHEVPLSPWLNTDRNISQICPLPSPTTALWLQMRWPTQLTHSSCLAVRLKEQNSS